MIPSWKEVSARHVTRCFYPEYPLDLSDIEIGKPFEMFNYDGIYMRVIASSDMYRHYTRSLSHKNRLFNDDGFHVPIIAMIGSHLEIGYLFYMAKSKPIRLWNGVIRF